jgi:hypothetical protein
MLTLTGHPMLDFYKNDGRKVAPNAQNDQHKGSSQGGQESSTLRRRCSLLVGGVSHSPLFRLCALPVWLRSAALVQLAPQISRSETMLCATTGGHCIPHPSTTWAQGCQSVRRASRLGLGQKRSPAAHQLPISALEASLLGVFCSERARGQGKLDLPSCCIISRRAGLMACCFGAKLLTIRVVLSTKTRVRAAV